MQGDTMFPSAKDLKVHIKDQHPKNVVCRICEQMFGRKFQIRRAFSQRS